MHLLILLKFRHPIDTNNLIWPGGIAFDFTSDVYLTLTDNDKDTIARVGLATRRLVFWCVFSLTWSLCSYRSKRFRSSLAVQKVYFALSHLISRYLTYKSRTAITSDIYFCWRRSHIHVSSLPCNLSLTWKWRRFNIIGIYVHFFLLPARDTVRPIITDWTSASNSHMHTNILQYLFRICGPSSALWHLIDQLAVKILKHDNMAVPQ